MIKQIYCRINQFIIKKIASLDTDLYLKAYTKYLKKIGISFDGEKKKIKYVDPSVYFDSNMYSRIHIGDNVTISREVMFLTHDYSITTAVCSVGEYIDRHEGELYFSRDIIVGNNCFIGARVSLLPGTTIGANCIIGAGSVVRGDIPEGSIVVGNPAKVVGNTMKFAIKHLEKGDFYVEK